jgi:hypothetical protein
MRNHWRMLLVALAAAVVATAAGVITASGGEERKAPALGGAYAKPDNQPAGRALKLKRAVPNREAFAVLARRPNIKGQLRAKLAREARRGLPRFARGRFRASDVRLSRRVGGTAALVVSSAADDEVCLIAATDQSAFTCGPSSYAQTVGLVNIVSCDNTPGAPKRQITVLVPDGAPQPTLKSNGKPDTKLGVVNNTAASTDTEADAITMANGATLPLPPLNC